MTRFAVIRYSLRAMAPHSPLSQSERISILGSAHQLVLGIIRKAPGEAEVLAPDTRKKLELLCGQLNHFYLDESTPPRDPWGEVAGALSDAQKVLAKMQFDPQAKNVLALVDTAAELCQRAQPTTDEGLAAQADAEAEAHDDAQANEPDPDERGDEIRNGDRPGKRIY